MDASKESNIVSFNPGDFVIREKTGCDALFIIKEGQLEVFKTGGNGEKIVLGLVSSGQYIGETALLLGKAHSSNVVALTPVKAIKLQKTSIEAQLKAVPAWLIALTKGLIERLQNQNEIMRRNGWIDENLAARVKTIEEKFKKE
ncbi:MAG: cyclic nucleotide-binding domain-containing protein [Bdellovibrionales bacterium]|nr:cyclic nucleotide-binding domain-containing protein [Bdellovibrionales bacterium]